MSIDTSGYTVEDFGNALKFMREKWKKSYSEMSRRIDVTEELYRGFESGKMVPDAKTMNYICALAGSMNKFKSAVTFERQRRTILKEEEHKRALAERDEAILDRPTLEEKKEPPRVTDKPQVELSYKNFSSFGAALKHYRETVLKWSREELAEYYRISHTLLGRIEGNSSAVPEDLYLRWCAEMTGINSAPRPTKLSAGLSSQDDVKPPPAPLPSKYVPPPPEPPPPPKSTPVNYPARTTTPLRLQETSLAPPPVAVAPQQPPPPPHFTTATTSSTADKAAPPQATPAEAAKPASDLKKWSKAIVTYSLKATSMSAEAKEAVINLLMAANEIKVSYEDVIDILNDND